MSLYPIRHASAFVPWVFPFLAAAGSVSTTATRYALYSHLSHSGGQTQLNQNQAWVPEKLPSFSTFSIQVTFFLRRSFRST